MICELVLYDKIRKTLCEGIITKDFKPRVSSRRYQHEYEMEYVMFNDRCYSKVKTFQIDGLNQLKTLIIGNNSFTQKKNSYGNDKSKSFHISNCKLLESLEIGEYSFSDFAGYFQLSFLSSLRSIKIGSANAFSYCFYGSTFTIRGMPSI